MTRSIFNQTTAQESFELNDLTYDLPEELIAQTPSEVRHQSRLLHVDRASGNIEHRSFSDIKTLLKEGDVLIINDTRVVPSRLYARRDSGGTIRLLLIRPLAEKINLWEALVTPIKRLRIGETLSLVSDAPTESKITITDIILDQDGFKRLVVDLGRKEDVYNILQSVGYAPLPPYIVRAKPIKDREATEDSEAHDGPELAEAPVASAKSAALHSIDEHEIDAVEPDKIGERLCDLDRYQTVFAKNPGAVAAPTAGLHFSVELLEELRASGVIVEPVTLHVGPGTFKPISTDVANHSIEAERFSVPRTTADAVNLAKSEGRRVIAVGTTSLRALETAGASGVLQVVDQAETRLYVKPGFNFKIVDAMVTNFHLSGSSLLVLVATFAGKDTILSAYKEAVEKRYRFFSYGDAMFIS
ncbi:MAG: S-adenosylmethionine:tRNA ribosyltransferase-isomerase [Candidatus Melainabacteria bacterium]|nr:S-adenosylmethionine:tRNA ribosyltransferase-isomerase [Candidatus Melainabacteria bacterium]